MDNRRLVWRSKGRFKYLLLPGHKTWVCNLVRAARSFPCCFVVSGFYLAIDKRYGYFLFGVTPSARCTQNCYVIHHAIPPYVWGRGFPPPPPPPLLLHPWEFNKKKEGKLPNCVASTDDDLKETFHNITPLLAWCTFAPLNHPLHHPRYPLWVPLPLFGMCAKRKMCHKLQKMRRIFVLFVCFGFFCLLLRFVRFYLPLPLPPHLFLYLSRSV